MSLPLETGHNMYVCDGCGADSMRPPRGPELGDVIVCSWCLDDYRNVPEFRARVLANAGISVEAKLPRKVGVTR